jgi:alpha-2-macroglobulin
VPLEGGGLGGGGGDVALASALERAADDEDDVRRDFPDTAFWEASLTTANDGTAVVEIPLPDTTTIWRLSSKAVTSDTLVGQSYVDIQATLPLLLRPVTPRFFTVGDEVQVGTIVQNNTDESIEARVTLQASGLTLAAGTAGRTERHRPGQPAAGWCAGRSQSMTWPGPT